MAPAGLVRKPGFAGFDTVVLAGGRAARMAGADKPGLEVGGTAMVVWVARAAAAAGTGRIVVVGPDRPGAVQAALAAAAAGVPGGLIRVSEHPPLGGPVAALRRGLAEVTAPWVAVLAADLPFLAGQHLTDLLLAGRAAEATGAVLSDDDGRLQWLAGVWQAGPLRLRLASDVGGSLGALLGPLGPVVLRLAAAQPGAPPWLDCDTPTDLAAARRFAQPEPTFVIGPDC